MVFIFFETVCYGTLLAYVTVNTGIQCADRIRLFARVAAAIVSKILHYSSALWISWSH